MYSNSRGVTKDEAEGITWLRKAAGSEIKEWIDRTDKDGGGIVSKVIPNSGGMGHGTNANHAVHTLRIGQWPILITLPGSMARSSYVVSRKRP